MAMTKKTYYGSGRVYSADYDASTFPKVADTKAITPEEAAAKIEEQKKEITGEPQNLEEQAISLVGRDIYEKLVKGYTEKQWGRDCKELPAFIIKRLPVRLTFDNNYFNALYQGIPIGGYTKLVENLLEGIEVRLNENYLKDKAKWNAMAKKVVYTGAIDAYFDYTLGNLEYRSVRFENEILDMPNFQGNAAVNYTDRETPWTRIIEHKWFEFGKDENGNEIEYSEKSIDYRTIILVKFEDLSENDMLKKLGQCFEYLLDSPKKALDYFLGVRDNNILQSKIEAFKKRSGAFIRQNELRVNLKALKNKDLEWLYRRINKRGLEKGSSRIYQ